MLVNVQNVCWQIMDFNTFFEVTFLTSLTPKPAALPYPCSSLLFLWWMKDEGLTAAKGRHLLWLHWISVDLASNLLELGCRLLAKEHLTCINKAWMAKNWDASCLGAVSLEIVYVSYV